MRKTKEEVLEEFRCTSIQDAVVAVVGRRGMEAATVQEIADEAGISKATFYVYFKDREEALNRTTDAIFERLLEAIEPVFASDAPLGERLRQLARQQLAYFDQFSAFFIATQALYRRGGKEPSRCLGIYIQRLERFFTEARARGELRDVDPHLVAAVYRDILRGAVLRRFEKAKKRSAVEADADAIVSIVLRGVESGDS